MYFPLLLRTFLQNSVRDDRTDSACTERAPRWATRRIHTLLAARRLTRPRFVPILFITLPAKRKPTAAHGIVFTELIAGQQCTLTKAAVVTAVRLAVFCRLARLTASFAAHSAVTKSTVGSEIAVGVYIAGSGTLLALHAEVVHAPTAHQIRTVIVVGAVTATVLRFCGSKRRQRHNDENPYDERNNEPSFQH